MFWVDNVEVIWFFGCVCFDWVVGGFCFGNIFGYCFIELCDDEVLMYIEW